MKVVLETHLGPPDKSFEFLHEVVTIPRTQFVMPFPHLPNCYVHVTLRAVCQGQEDITVACPQTFEVFLCV